MVGWIFYGGLTLMRAVPRYREPPAWLMRFGIADIVLLGATLACLAAVCFVPHVLLSPAVADIRMDPLIDLVHTVNAKYRATARWP